MTKKTHTHTKKGKLNVMFFLALSFNTSHLKHGALVGFSWQVCICRLRWGLNVMPKL